MGKVSQTIRSPIAVIEGAATESVAPMPVRKAENPIKVDFRRFLLPTWEAIQARISLSMSVERLAHEASSVAGSRASCEMSNRFNQEVVETARIGALRCGGVDIEQDIRLKSGNRRAGFAARRRQDPGAQRRVGRIEHAGEMHAAVDRRTFARNHTLEDVAERCGREFRHLDF